MKRVEREFDDAFDVVEDQFPDVGTIELHEDEHAAADNGAGSERQFAYCMDGDPIIIAFAPKAARQDPKRLRGLMRHELGHALEYRYGVKELEKRLGKLPAEVERRADVIAERVFGDPIVYDADLVQCVGRQGQRPRPAHLPDKREKLKANPGSNGTYHFVGSCPGAPTWWIEWVIDEEAPGYDDEVPWEQLESDLAADSDFQAFMREWLVHPAEDDHVTYYRTRSPLGVPLIIIQHSGIENIWAAGDIDLDAEEREAEQKGFWYLA